MTTTADIIGLHDSIKALLETNLIADQATAGITAGQDAITIEATCPFQDGDTVLIYAPETNAQAHQRQVIIRPDNVLFLSAPIPADMPTARIQKLVDGMTIKGIYVGQPNHLPAFPSITITGEMSNEPFALGGLYNVTYSNVVSVYADGPDFETANRNAHHLARQVEATLTHQISPACTRPSIWKSALTGIAEDHQVNRDSTLKVIHIGYQVDETIQRLAAEMPVNLAMD